MNSVISLRVSDEEKQAWMEAAGSPRSLSRWLRQVANAALEGEGSSPPPGSGTRDLLTAPVVYGCAVHEEFTPWCVDCQRNRR